MDSVEKYDRIVHDFLQRYTRIPLSDDATVNYEKIFDVDRHRYLLLAAGWSKGQRVHHTVIHIDIIEGEVWIQANNTDRLIAEDLVEAGVPRESIILGLQPPEIRPYTDYGGPTVDQQDKSLIYQ